MTERTPHPYAAVLHAIAEGHTVQWRDDEGAWWDQSHYSNLCDVTARNSPPARYRTKPDDSLARLATQASEITAVQS